MKHLSQSFLADEVSSDDEIDELFYQLEPIEPPPSLVARIMDAVAHLPLPTLEPLSDQAEELDGLVVQHHSVQPS
jgi:hypothetical protein